jgi:hypothetical protein
MAKYINYQASLITGTDNYLITENNNEQDKTSLDSILNVIESLKQSSDKFLQNIIDHNNYLLSCNKPKKNEDEEDFGEEN